MPFVSITRLRVRSWRFMPQFLLLTLRTQRQVQAATGFRGGSLLADRHRTFWTMTLWDEEAHMRAYTTAGAHRTAMPKLVDWCDQASVVHWEQHEAQFPSWADAEARMRRDGRPSKVRHPSPGHSDLTFEPARTTAGVPILPRR